jgi:hypothetical protein
VAGVGECFELGRHPQGTEVKAITFSNMQVWASAAAPTSPAAGTGTARGDDDAAAAAAVAQAATTAQQCHVEGGGARGRLAEVFVIVDI